MDADIAAIESSLKGEIDLICRYAYTVTAKQLIRQNLVKSNPLVLAFLLLLAQKRPVDLVHGGAVDLGKALSEYNLKEYHHVFPRAHLKGKEIAREKFNSLCNFCFLSADSNKRISSKAPGEYVFSIVPQNNLADILDSNLLPLNREVYEKNDFESFMTLRSQKVLDFLDKQLV